jgi:N utilization substance protein B
MKARTAARELALLLLFQQEGTVDVTWDKASFPGLLVQTVRTLVHLAEERITAVTETLADLQNVLTDYEIDHPDNAYVPVDLPTKPVPIPTTHEMSDRLDTLLQAVSHLEDALAIPELYALAGRKDVENYCRMLMQTVKNRQDEIDKGISSVLPEDWPISRLQKMDLALLRLAVAELIGMNNRSPALVIDEVLELAKRYAAPEGRAFIHGVLGAWVDATSSVTPEEISHA